MSIELLVAVPILLLCVMAIVQFGLELAGAVIIHQSASAGGWTLLHDRTSNLVRSGTTVQRPPYSFS
ncbi:MAG UNVERIFIED_CONTAM: hypothetical protein LVR18_51855 [Planctomycetaceae bacterium]|jgi:hypothetical protein